MDRCSMDQAFRSMNSRSSTGRHPPTRAGLKEWTRFQSPDTILPERVCPAPKLEDGLSVLKPGIGKEAFDRGIFVKGLRILPRAESVMKFPGVFGPELMRHRGYRRKCRSLLPLVT
ncbi:MAG: hypothetical protein A2X56_10325 [Nitrospirae bacterium GWC2_57_13]|jgi:hypothetical protein|nr:MAG: hypothetical protein A2X56_10325 [Nitrospirae bacterium GWC2_57_13]OGW46181.1 MAG: hypothetical protein A2X57_04685 [Nitrospirae bacterium GWD2_57_8]HAR46267.1 hypothetical protein [Nitrospiraceae bacterium]HAS55214.1 hypothetical protein [Nitrospiraceae bacterium]